jgi:hypothetical protein
MQQEDAERAFQLVELFAPQALDLLGEIVAIDRGPAALANDPGLLHQP